MAKKAESGLLSATFEIIWIYAHFAPSEVSLETNNKHSPENENI